MGQDDELSPREHTFFISGGNLGYGIGSPKIMYTSFVSVVMSVAPVDIKCALLK